MVEREKKIIEAAHIQSLIAGGTIRRGANGEWTLEIQVDGDLPIDEYRTLPLRGRLKLKGRQEGRRPHSSPNWSKGGGFKKKAK